MIANLDQSLEPGEIVVYRTRGRAFAGTVVFWTSFLVGLALVEAGIQSITPVPDMTYWDRLLAVCAGAGGIGAFCALVILIAVRRQRNSPDDLLITDRRLLFSKGGWTRKFESVDLRRIERLALSDSVDAAGFEITTADRVLSLPRFRNESGLAEALAAASGCPGPPDLGPMAIADLRFFGFLLTAAAAYPAIWLGLGSLGLHAPEGPLSLDVWWVDFMVLLATILIGTLVANLVTVAIMRPFATAKQMQAWLCAGRPEKRRLRIALKWAGLLYRRPMPYVAC